MIILAGLAYLSFIALLGWLTGGVVYAALLESRRRRDGKEDV